MISASIKVQLVGACGLICLIAILVQAQYNTFDSDSNSDSDGSPILAKLVRKSGKPNQYQNQYQSNEADATRQLYNRQQPMQLAPSYHNNKRSLNGGVDGYGSGSPFMGSSSEGRGFRNSDSSSAKNDDDDDDARESANFGPNFNSNFDGESSGANQGGNNNDDDVEGSNANNEGGSPMNLNQAASGYPNQGGDSVSFAAGFGFGSDASAYGPGGAEGEGAGFGPSGGDYGGDGRRAKSASSPAGSRNYAGLDDDSGASLRYGPNSAVNSGERDPDDEGRSSYQPEAGNQADQDNDDE